MGILIQILPLIIQLTEAILGRGKVPQKLAFATELAQHVLGQAAHHGLVATADAHEVGLIQSKIHETVEAMRADGRLVELDKEMAPVPVAILVKTEPATPQPKSSPFGEEVDFSQI